MTHKWNWDWKTATRQASKITQKIACCLKGYCCSMLFEALRLQRALAQARRQRAGDGAIGRWRNVHRLLQAEEAHVNQHPGGLEMFLGRFGEISAACLEVIVGDCCWLFDCCWYLKVFFFIVFVIRHLDLWTWILACFLGFSYGYTVWA